MAWKGWGWTPEKRADFEARKSTIVLLAQRQISATYIFVMNLGVTPRMLERMEKALGKLFNKMTTHCVIAERSLRPDGKPTIQSLLRFGAGVSCTIFPHTSRFRKRWPAPDPVGPTNQSGKYPLLQNWKEHVDQTFKIVKATSQKPAAKTLIT